MSEFIVASFYKFIKLEDYEALRDPILQIMKQHDLLGTIILATEGINGSFAGTPDNILFLYTHLMKDRRLADLYFKETPAEFMPFEKAKVKFRKEIVTMGIPNLDPNVETGIHVSPIEWNALISDPDVLLVDTRNTYEIELGTFKNAIDPRTENFRDFPEYVRNQLMDKKDKKIAMCCTGGIRCEKSTAYLKSLGFKHVYQLQGGILHYLDSMPEEQSLWQGSCFVFDERIALEKNADREDSV